MLLNTTISDTTPHIGENGGPDDDSRHQLERYVTTNGHRWEIGIPAGLSLQPWQLKRTHGTQTGSCLLRKIFDNYLVLYWMGFAPKETKTIQLDLKAEIPGTYKAKSSNVYLYYTPEYKHWNQGLQVQVRQNPN